MLFNFSNLKSSLLSGLYCSAICFGGALALQATLSTSVMGQDALETLGELDKPVAKLPAEAAAPPTVSPQDQQRAELSKRLRTALFNELDNLVPGELTKDSPATEALYSAVDAYMQRKSDMALVILEQAASFNPNFPPAELLMAGMSIVAKDQNNGMRLLQAAAVKSPNNPAIYAAYGRLASGSSRNVDAKVHFEKMLTLLNESALDEISLAHYKKTYMEGMSLIAVRLKDYKQARLLCGQLMEIDPENDSALQLLATVAFQQDKLDEALMNLTKLRDKKPTSRAPEAVLGTWFTRAGKKSKASEWYNKLPVKYADDAAVQLEYASWALGQEDIEGAAAAIAKAEAAGKASPVSNNLKGKIAFFQRNYGEAVKIFKTLYEENPKNADYSNMYVLSMIESEGAENKALANQLANKNLQAYPNNRSALGSVGYVRMRTLGVNDQLKAIFTKVAQLRTQQRSPEVDYFLASFLKELGDNKNALAVIHQATQHEGLFLYRKQAEQMKQALAATMGLVPKS